MASVNETPVPDPARGIQALERDLIVVLRNRSVKEVGWCRSNDLTLLIPLWSTGFDFYLLRLQFHCYPEWPPSAQFVNPVTTEYRAGEDVTWLPLVEAPHIRVHADYSNSKRQLICNSSTLEFYELRHGLDNPDHIWRPESQNFNHTLATIAQALQGDHYRGRQR